MNKDVETCNMQEDTVVAHRLVCHYVSPHGRGLKVWPDRFAEGAEGKAGSQIAQLRTK